MKIAINGFGRIGRAVFRIIETLPDIEVVAINDLFDPQALRYLLQYDTVMGQFAGGAVLEEDEIVTANSRAKMFSERDPANLPWGELGIDAVVESTGVFRSRSQLEQHIAAGAERVLLTVPAKDDIDYTVVLGVNDEGLTADHRLVSNASCTTNCLAPIAKVINDAFGIERGMMTTVHAYTSDQSILDGAHDDLRRARAAAMSMIPTTTGAAKAVGLVIPELQGKLDGFAVRVPTPNVSLVDLSCTVKSSVSIDEVNRVLREASEGPLKGVLKVEPLPLVSQDYMGMRESSCVDVGLTNVIENMV